MTAVPKKAQNYIPISKQSRNRMKFAAEPRRIKTNQGNVSYIEDKRIQKMPSSSPRKIQPQGMGYARPQKTSPRPVMPRNIQPRMSAQGEIAVPLPQTGIRNQPREAAATEVRPAQTGIVSTILLIAVVFGILSFLLARNATITNISLENAEIQQRITTLSEDIDQLKVDITLKEDLNAIQERAAELSMSSPASNQITYLPEESVVESGTEQDTQDTALEEQSFSLNGLFKTLKSWLD
jgi:hypothetical protein